MNRNYEEERSELLIKKSGMPALHTFSFGDGASIMILMLDMIMTGRY